MPRTQIGSIVIQVNLDLALDAIAAVHTIFVNRCSGAAVRIFLTS